METKNPKGGSLAYIGALIFFFFAFFMVECGAPRTNELNRKINGVELATGAALNKYREIEKENGRNTVGSIPSPSSKFAFFALLCVLIGAPLSVVYNKRAAQVSYIVGAVGVISMIILPIHLYIEWKDQISLEYVHFRFGYFAVLGLLMAATYFCYKRYNENF